MQQLSPQHAPSMPLPLLMQPISSCNGACTRSPLLTQHTATHWVLRSERCGYQGVAGEYAYYADPIHQASRQPASDAPAPQPFKPVSPPKRGGPGTVARHFAARAKGAVGEFEWQPRPSEAPAAQQAGGEGGDATEAAAAAAPFRPAASPKKGPMATLSRYPEYLHDPKTLKAEAAAAERKAGRAKMSGAGWRPNGCDKSDATRSIVRMNLK